MPEKYRPKISGFVDFMQYHANGEPIYIYHDSLHASFDLLIPLKQRYDFSGPEVQREIENAIKQNAYFFDINSSDRFFWPNTNMFGYPCSFDRERGKVMIIKDKYRKQWR